jgi:PAS domain S-box-containing protein
MGGPGDPLLPPAFRAAPLALYVLDGEGCVRAWNRAAEALFGWCAEEVLGSADPTVGGGGAAGGETILDEVVAGVTVSGRVTARSRKGGVRVAVVLSASRIDDADGGFAGVVITAAALGQEEGAAAESGALLERERTARRHAEAAVRRARFLADGSALLDGSLDYASTLENLARHVVPALADYCLIDELEDDQVSRVALAHVDPLREPLLKRSMRQPLTGDPEKHPVVRVMTTGASVLVEEVCPATLESIAHDERHLALLHALELSSFLVVPLSARGKILGAITFAYGESGRRYERADLEMAEELGRRAGMAVEAARLYRESRRAVSARERLLAVVSHDLRNSLATVLLNASAVLETPGAARIEPSVRDQLQWIARSAEQMNRLISDLVDVSAIEAGRLSLKLARQPVARLVSDAAEMCRPLATEKRIGLELQCADGLPDVWADAQRLQQVLGNVLGNAIKFSPPESSIALRAIRDGLREEVRFEVSDRGPGIEAEHLPAIFDLYWQGHRGDLIGAGVGLAIAKAIVEAHDGRIWAESTPGLGSTFSFTLPLARD